MENNGAGKGDKPRHNLKKYSNNYDDIFRKDFKCPNDSNGDGDCYICYKYGGCENFNRLKREIYNK